nr:hypothetical protein Iba_chr05cCG18020 [Ipomoea batatas]
MERIGKATSLRVRWEGTLTSSNEGPNNGEEIQALRRIDEQMVNPRCMFRQNYLIDVKKASNEDQLRFNSQSSRQIFTRLRDHAQIEAAGAWNKLYREEWVETQPRAQEIFTPLEYTPHERFYNKETMAIILYLCSVFTHQSFLPFLENLKAFLSVMVALNSLIQLRKSCLQSSL